MIGAWVLDYPPNRFIGSELMTHELLKALQSRFDVKVATVHDSAPFVYDGVPVTHELSDCDLMVTHVGMPHTSWSQKISRQVAVCHNAEAETLLALHTRTYDLVVCNSVHMRDVLAEREPHRFMVIHPPAPAPAELSTGDRVTIVNLNDNKVGRFWDIAAELPEQAFLAVLGGYADQNIPTVVPPNVEIIDHVPRAQMWEQVWSRTRLLLAPSARESWNMTAGEALAHGIRTVSTDLPGVRENLHDTATYLDRDDVSAWVAAVTESPPPNVYAQQRALFNHDRYTSEVAEFVKAVERIGNNHDQTTHGRH